MKRIIKKIKRLYKRMHAKKIILKRKRIVFERERRKWDEKYHFHLDSDDHISDDWEYGAKTEVDIIAAREKYKKYLKEKEIKRIAEDKEFEENKKREKELDLKIKAMSLDDRTIYFNNLFLDKLDSLIKSYELYYIEDKLRDIEFCLESSLRDITTILEKLERKDISWEIVKGILYLSFIAFLIVLALKQ